MIDRMAHEIAERHKDLPELTFIGIRTRGVPLATRLAATLGDLVKKPFPVGTLDITLYRDDLSLVAPQPLLRRPRSFRSERPGRRALTTCSTRGAPSGRRWTA